LLLPRRLNTPPWGLVAGSTQARQATEPPGVTSVEDMKGLMLTNDRQNVLALQQTQTYVFWFAFKNFFKLFF